MGGGIVGNGILSRSMTELLAIIITILDGSDDPRELSTNGNLQESIAAPPPRKLANYKFTIEYWHFEIPPPPRTLTSELKTIRFYME